MASWAKRPDFKIITELMSFKRLHGERTDELLTRCETLMITSAAIWADGHERSRNNMAIPARHWHHQ